MRHQPPKISGIECGCMDSIESELKPARSLEEILPLPFTEQLISSLG